MLDPVAIAATGGGRANSNSPRLIACGIKTRRTLTELNDSHMCLNLFSSYVYSKLDNIINVSLPTFINSKKPRGSHYYTAASNSETAR